MEKQHFLPFKKEVNQGKKTILSEIILKEQSIHP